MNGILDTVTGLGSNIVAFIFALGVIIFVHEAGHLVMAKIFRMRVLAFSLGFGKRIWGFQRGETEYRVSIIPLGGYVRLGGEDPGEVSEDPHDFMNTPRWQRILVYLAGPAMNILLAIVLIALVLMVGIQVPSLREIPPVIGALEPDSPATEAGLQVGDRIVAVDGAEVAKWDDVYFVFVTSPDRALNLSIDRDGEPLELVLTPERIPKYEMGRTGAFPTFLPRIAQVVPNSPAEAAGFEPGDEIIGVDGRELSQWQEFVSHIEERPSQEVVVTVLRSSEQVELRVTPRDESGKGKIGVMHGYFQRLPPHLALMESLRFNWDMSRQTLTVLGKIVTGRMAAKTALSGPIEIAALSGAAARSGFKNLVQLMGLISISIAILNLLPIPVLDGGQITILLLESLSRRDLPLTVKERINQVGFLMIILLMVVVLYFDIVKNVPTDLLPGSNS
jgi:regulator of sigma E protease